MLESPASILNHDFKTKLSNRNFSGKIAEMGP